METSKQQSHHCQAERQAHKHDVGSMLCTNRWLMRKKITTFYEQHQAEIEKTLVLWVISMSKQKERTETLKESWEDMDVESGAIRDRDELCNASSIINGGTMFPSRDIHTVMWYSPSGRDRYYTDHLPISCWMSESQDARNDRQSVSASVRPKVRIYQKILDNFTFLCFVIQSVTVLSI